MDAVILVGGKGTRLQTVVKDRPKPMAEVQGRPFVEHILDTLRSQGVQRVILAIGYQADVVTNHFTRNPYPWVELAFSKEAAPLGTGGAVRNALPVVHSTRLLVLNGDSYCRFSVEDLLNQHRRCRALATLWLTATDDCRRYGSVEVDPDGKVTLFKEKSAEREPGLVSAGVYLLERELIRTIPPDQELSLETEFFPSLIGKGLCAAVGAGPFLDIGTPESYAAATEFFALVGSR